MHEHPEDHDKIEKLKDLIAWQVKILSLIGLKKTVECHFWENSEWLGFFVCFSVGFFFFFTAVQCKDHVTQNRKHFVIMLVDLLAI